jgi:dihydrofolate synthase/folylpolyglutamate synthase
MLNPKSKINSGLFARCFSERRNSMTALDYIHSLLTFGSKPGLERIKKLLFSLGNPEKKLNIIHVAGTNGKGSVCTYISSILRTKGLKTGLYISPFVVCFNERIQINGEYISDSNLEKYTEIVREHSKKVYCESDPITEFEFITALAFKYFADNNCDAVVLEVGLGGRLDATNVITSPKVSVITKIDLDHTGVLGDTVGEIAKEKCGIIKKNCPTVTMCQNKGEALNVITDTASEMNSRLFVTEQPEKISKSDIFGSEFVYDGNCYFVPLAGDHQIDNAVTAITAVKTAYPDISEEHIKNGLKFAKFPARCEIVSFDPFILLDGSHNPNGTNALSRLLKNGELDGAVAVVGFMADKDVEDAVKEVGGLFSKMITVSVKSNKRSMTAEDLKEICLKYCGDVTASEDYESAINIALKTDKPIIVFGSLYLAGDIRPLLLQKKTK